MKSSEGLFQSCPILLRSKPVKTTVEARCTESKEKAQAVSLLPWKVSHSPPAALVQPLPVHPRPWSYVAIDFVTELPPPKGNALILTVVDRCSKVVHFVPLPKLPQPWRRETFWWPEFSSSTVSPWTDRGPPERLQKTSRRPCGRLPTEAGWARNDKVLYMVHHRPPEPNIHTT